MCLVLYADHLESHSLVLAANRDEFLNRPTTSAGWHDFPFSAPPALLHPSPDSTSTPKQDGHTLSGLDLTAGGTWLGLSLPPSSYTGQPKLRFATLTNFTEAIPTKTKTSRGELVKKFLEQEAWSLTMVEFLKEVEKTKQNYAGFNLLMGEFNTEKGEWQMGYASNREPGNEARVVPPAVGVGQVTGLSNDTLILEGHGVRWPKVESGSKLVHEVLSEAETESESEDREKELVNGLWEALTTAYPNPIRSRIHLRHTVLVKPIFFDPNSPLPPFPPSVPPPVSAEEEERLAKTVEGTNSGHWYATRVQTIVVAEKPVEGKEGVKVTLWERDAYVLGKEGLPEWSGQVRKFEIMV